MEIVWAILQSSPIIVETDLKKSPYPLASKGYEVQPCYNRNKLVYHSSTTHCENTFSRLGCSKILTDLVTVKMKMKMYPIAKNCQSMLKTYPITRLNLLKICKKWLTFAKFGHTVCRVPFRKSLGKVFTQRTVTTKWTLAAEIFCVEYLNRNLLGIHRWLQYY